MGSIEVNAAIQDPELIALSVHTRAVVHLDAYPDMAFRAVFESASPVASSALQSPIKTFNARFRLVGSNPHPLPDLSAAVDIEIEDPAKGNPR